MLKSVLMAFAISLSCVVAAAGQPNYPLHPDPTLTPGDYCRNPDSRRYPERIAYCSRDVKGDEKWAVIEQYNEKLGYRIDRGNRNQFKIDHLIPLCAGGGNNAKNLWPQHQSVYTVTDPLEPLICGKMAEGKLSQKDAVELIFKAKFDLSKVDEVMAQLQAL